MKCSPWLVGSFLLAFVCGSALAAEPSGETAPKNEESVPVFTGIDTPNDLTFRDDRHFFHGYLWNTNVTGRLGLKGMGMSIDSGAGMSESLTGGADFGMFLTKRDRLNVSLHYFDHNGNINQAVAYDNLNYANGASLHLKSKWLEVGGARVLGNERDSGFEFLYGLYFVHRIMDLDGTDLAKAIIQSGSWAKKTYAPYVGLFGQTRHSSKILVEGHLKAGGFGLFDGAINFGVRLNAIEDYQKSDWFATVGYRASVIKDSGVDFGYTGPVFGVFGRF